MASPSAPRCAMRSPGSAAVPCCRRTRRATRSASSGASPSRRLRSLRSAASPAAALDRAARLRDRHPGDPDRVADRIPDQRDRRVSRRAAAAAVRRGDLHRRSGRDRGAARDGRAAHGDHRRRPLGQRLRRRDRRHAPERRDRRAAVDGRRLLRSAGPAAADRAGDRVAAARRSSPTRWAWPAARCCPRCCSTSR